MIKNSFLSSCLLSLSLCLTIDAAEMVRVVGVAGGSVLIVERGATRETARLAGVDVTDELRARELLLWTIGSSWVMREPAGDGTWRVWRSPDALFINRELVVRGYAKPTLPGIAPERQLMVTYLGEVDPAGAQPRARKPAAQPRVSPAASPRTRIGTSRRSSGSRTRAPRSARAAPAGP